MDFSSRLLSKFITLLSSHSPSVVVSHRGHHPDLREELEEFHQYLLDEAREMPELKAWQLQGQCWNVPLLACWWSEKCVPLTDLGLQAAQRVMSSDDPLRTMQDISQNLPVLGKYVGGVPWLQKKLSSLDDHPSGTQVSVTCHSH